MQTILVCDDDKQIVEAIDIYPTVMRFWSIWKTTRPIC